MWKAKGRSGGWDEGIPGRRTVCPWLGGVPHHASADQLRSTLCASLGFSWLRKTLQAAGLGLQVRADRDAGDPLLSRVLEPTRLVPCAAPPLAL